MVAVSQLLRGVGYPGPITSNLNKLHKEREKKEERQEEMDTSSLDKSLQKKCVVEDMGQGEGGVVAVTESTGTAESCSHKQKTEKNAGDGGGGGGASGGTVVSASATSSGAALTTVTAAATTTTMSKSLQSAAIDDSTTHLAANNPASHTTITQPTSAFDTKVKQISKNLKETSIEDGTSSSSSSSSSSSTSSSCSLTTSASSSSSSPSSTPTEVINEHGSSSVIAVDQHNAVVPAPDAAVVYNTESSATVSTNESALDEADHRSKKVRFHPDVKENDGGKRVIPKKKKKFKINSIYEAGCNRPASNSGADDEMELEEDDDFEEEEDFDLTKTIAEAQDYLKTHPLTFVRPQDKSAGLLQNGLLEEEDLPLLSESSEDEDFYDSQPTENGVERILGKQIKCGKVEFLLRYVDRPGLFWETEEYIWKVCPNLLNLYEHNRERRQERLMRHVAKRQNLRQRYTDF